jgi:FkbM family methyltransferase
LTTSAVGSSFDRVVLFEPNPLCLGILETNVAISLTRTAYEIRRYGLGRENSRLTLRVPRSNWGGAYVVSDDNAYSSEALLAKDGFAKDDPESYLSLEIDICHAADILGRLFAELIKDGKSHGSVKIDVEGFESVVLQAIAETLPPEMGLSIIFEHLGDEFDSEKILSAFRGRAHLYALVRAPSVVGSRWRKLWSLLTSGVETYSLEPWAPGVLATDLILKVDSVGSDR